MVFVMKIFITGGLGFVGSSLTNFFLNNGHSFAEKPDAIVPVGDAWKFGVADIDGDGLSDIAAQWFEDKDPLGIEHCRVFFVREGEQ